MILSCRRNESSNVIDITNKSCILRLTFSFLCGLWIHTQTLTHTKHTQQAGRDWGGDIWNSSMSFYEGYEDMKEQKKRWREKKSVVIPLSFSSSRSLPLQTPSGMSELQLRQTALTGMKVTVCLCVRFICAHPKKKKTWLALTDRLSCIITDTPSCLLPYYLKTNMYCTLPFKSLGVGTFFIFEWNLLSSTRLHIWSKTLWNIITNENNCFLF